MADVIESSGAGTLTVDDIFQDLSKGDKSEKEATKSEPSSDKDDSDEDKGDLIPLKSKEKDDEKETSDEESGEEDGEEDGDNEEGDEDSDDEELKEEDEDELELSKIPTRAQIKAKYPNIFKEFRALDKIFYREKEFAEVFPTVKDAKSAKAEIAEYNQIQDELLSGDVVGILSRVKQANPKAYEKISSNIIDSLIKVDKDSYLEAARYMFKSGLTNIYSMAGAALKKDPTSKKAEQMQIAAELVHEALFGTSEVSSYSKQEKEEDKINPELEALRRERAGLENNKLQEAHSKVSDRFYSSVVKTLEKNVDTKNVLTDYTKKNLVKDIREELDRQLIADKRFGGIVRKLYDRARESNYSQASLDNIITALKNKAGSILPEIMRAKKGEALKGSSNVRKITKTRELSRENESEDATTRNSRTGDKRESLTRNERSKESDTPRPDESALDYLNRKLG